MKKQEGFTIIELIIVIVILGILAAYAVPKYMSVDREARISTVKALAGSLKSAAEMVYGISSIKGKTGGRYGTNVDIGRGIKVDTFFGYPVGTEKGIMLAINDPAPSFKIEYETDGHPSVTFSPKGAPQNNPSEETLQKLSDLITDGKLTTISTQQLEALGFKGCYVSYMVIPDETSGVIEKLDSVDASGPKHKVYTQGELIIDTITNGC